MTPSEEFSLKIRAIVLEYYPNNYGHTITIDLPQQE
jgi:hypothetical protein